MDNLKNHLVADKRDKIKQQCMNALNYAAQSTRVERIHDLSSLMNMTRLAVLMSATR